MPIVNYIEAGGTAHAIEVAEGVSLMEGAVSHGVPGIDGDCGGNCACATCHVFVDDKWLALTGERTEMESAMLEFAEGVQPNSRLCCQIMSDHALDGITVHMPAGQH